MARSLRDLADSLDAKAKAVETVVSKVAVDITVLLETQLLDRTPVDTSQALSNWQVTLNAPTYSFIKPYVPGYLGYTQNASIQAALSAAKTALAAKEPGQSIFIANNAPYIKGLNSGTSRQAPAGFVEAAVLIARKNLRELKIKF